MQNKFKIEFNKELKVLHHATLCENEEISNQKVFQSVTCFLNFRDDRVEFQLKIDINTWTKLTKLQKFITYEKLDSTIHEKFAFPLLILNDEIAKEEKDSDFIIAKIHGDIKNILLQLFSPLCKEFKLKFIYVLNEKTYQTTFNVKIPNINQKDWYPAVSKTQLYKPETVDGIALVKLYQNGFKLRSDSSATESSMRRELLDYSNATISEKFKKFDFLQNFKRMLAFEDLFSFKEMENYSLSHQKVSHFITCRYSLRETIKNHLKFVMCERKMKSFVQKTYIIEAIRKMPLDVQEFDHIYLTDMQDYQQFYDDLHEIAEQRVTGKIYYIFGNLILFQLVLKSRRGLKESYQPSVDEDRPYHVEFLPNRVAVRCAHRAVEDAKKNNLKNYLADLTMKTSREMKEMMGMQFFEKFQWMNSAIRRNNEQKAAVRNIVNCTSFPMPYIIFGPPGTGKSTTIIEAIAQIVKLKPLVHILVTASSNSACDDLAIRLLKYISINKILRIYSPSFDKKPDRINKILEPISNFRNRHVCNCNKRSCPEIGSCDDPTYEEFYTSRVVIATLVSCGRIVSAGVKSNHFDYIFIDEAASDSEPFQLIPISGLGSSSQGITAQIVLSGDHKQLGAIVREKFCRKLGMEMSWMERIMEMNEKYQRNPTYNKHFVTQLIQNYRSHEAILQFSNENFYDSQLVAKCPPEIANFACGWDFLLYNKNFPLLFHTTLTPSTEVGMSLKNEGEVALLDNYIQVLLRFGINGSKVEQSDIGIISPYRAQRDRILEQYQAEFPKIEIGTVDAFQGREKKIIMMSTVRSQTTHVGFLRNEKRLNVGLTRAKSLLLIIGNSATLQRCLIWNKFIAYCYKNRAVVGDCNSINKSKINDETFEGNEEKPEEYEDEYDD